MNWLQEIFDKHEIELRFKFIEFEHKIIALYEPFLKQLEDNAKTRKININRKDS
jgi:hypothetical protein